MDFNPSLSFPNVVMTWIRFPALPSYLYNRKIITEIGELVGIVVKLDLNTDSKSRGRFARMVAYVNLKKPLVSRILINGRIQTVEYESLSTICFHYGRYGHAENIYSFKALTYLTEKTNHSSELTTEIQKSTVDESEKKDDNFGPWMIVERRSRRKPRDNSQKFVGAYEKDKESSHPSGLTKRHLTNENWVKDTTDLRKLKGKGVLIDSQSTKKSDFQNNGHVTVKGRSVNGSPKEIGLNLNPGPAIDKFTVPLLGSSSAIISSNELVKDTELLTTDLGRENSLLNIACNLVTREAQAGRKHHVSGTSNNSSRCPATIEAVSKQDFIGEAAHEGEASFIQAISSPKEYARSLVVVDVGNLDSRKHSAVTFFENKDTSSLNKPLNLKGFLDLGKKDKFGGKASKQDKKLHGSSVKFKNISS
ncbi:hypothetical protein J1N35_012278 [Gossypium stocksii]|uniref:DUF4283 domain-containing protein n=1 Tax=Gossypium stocksii TaxID=47602 RepID=A0A9D4AE54_9ROSI|nr:hypothetical protein J1N35_012278 [Gossypium stocksii]